uniref:transposase n=2 Tax=Streptomyces scabiei TaxID=1930 RepID=UPI001F09E2F6
MSERKPYKTDVSDEQWALVEPVIVAWKAAHPSVSGCQGRYAMREIVNALLYPAGPVQGPGVCPDRPGLGRLIML